MHWIRRLSQVIFLFLFVYTLFFISSAGYSTFSSLFLRFDPLMILTGEHKGIPIMFFVLVLTSAAVAAVWGRVFCSWACPLGSVLDAFDGIALNKDESRRDMLVVEAGEHEDVYMAEFDLDQLRDYRRRETWGNAFRRPRLYGDLVAQEVREPFERERARR